MLVRLWRRTLIGVLLLDNARDWAAALKEWRVLAEQGHANAQGNLGNMYYAGYGVS